MTIIFAQNLRYFRAIFFCELFAFFWRNLRKPGNIFLRIFAHETKRILRNFLHKFLSKLTKIEILSRELNN